MYYIKLENGKKIVFNSKLERIKDISCSNINCIEDNCIFKDYCREGYTNHRIGLVIKNSLIKHNK